MSLRAKEERRFILVFLAPAFLIFSIFVFLPAVRALLYSFQKWDGLGTPEWIGLGNFVRLLRDDTIFLVALGHNVLLFTIAGGLTIAMALFFASLLSQKIRGATLFRIVFFFPNVLAMVAVALLWILLYSTTDFGVINAMLGRIETATVASFGTDCEDVYQALREVKATTNTANCEAVREVLSSVELTGATIDCDTAKALLREVQAAASESGCDSVSAIVGAVDSSARTPIFPFPFLQSKYLMASIIPMIIWSLTGFYMVLFLAGMGGIPQSYYEAARLEGASHWQQFWHITLPLLREIIVVAVVFMIISLMKYFDPIWVMENEVPNRESHVLATLLYQKVFTEYDMGYASAVAVLLFLIVLAASTFSMMWSRKERIEY